MINLSKFNISLKQDHSILAKAGLVVIIVFGLLFSLLIFGLFNTNLLPSFMTSQSVEIAVSESPIKLHPKTNGSVKQVAVHLSKMSGGETVGGFPGFEPPEDEPDYHQKIKNRDYSPRYVNDWIKDINKHLQQIVDKNPGLSLDEILYKIGLSSTQVANFIDRLRDAHAVALGHLNYGVSVERLNRLEALLQQTPCLPGDMQDNE